MPPVAFFPPMVGPSFKGNDIPVCAGGAWGKLARCLSIDKGTEKCAVIFLGNQSRCVIYPINALLLGIPMAECCQPKYNPS